jgi:hypothetical protein
MELYIKFKSIGLKTSSKQLTNHKETFDIVMKTVASTYVYDVVIFYIYVIFVGITIRFMFIYKIVKDKINVIVEIFVHRFRNYPASPRRPFSLYI